MTDKPKRRTRTELPASLHPKVLQEAADILATLRAELTKQDADIGDDPLLLQDMIEGEIKEGEIDGVAIIRSLILASIDLRLSAAACKARAAVYNQAAKDLRGREDRLEALALKFRSGASLLMQEAGLRAFQDDAFSAWIAPGNRTLAGEADLSKLPEEYVETVVRVRVSDLVRDLIAGREIPGAPPLTNAPDVLFVKAK